MGSKEGYVEPSEFDHYDVEIMDRAYELYTAYQAICPVAHSNRYGGFAFSDEIPDLQANPL